jgi:hypothetical protein
MFSAVSLVLLNRVLPSLAKAGRVFKTLLKKGTALLRALIVRKSIITFNYCSRAETPSVLSAKDYKGSASVRVKSSCYVSRRKRCS